MNQTKIKVIDVKTPPQLKNPAIQQGIRDRAAAENWGQKNGYAIVYFMARKQRVYAERLTVKVHDQAKQLEQASAELLQQMEMAL